MPSTTRQTVLAIGAHLDDAFIGAGGLLLQAARAGCRVVVVTLVSDFSTRSATRGQEQATIADIHALGKRHGFEMHLMGCAYHRVDGSDMHLKQRLAQIAVEVKPDVALIHHDRDHWPDHSAAAKLGFDAVMFTHGLTSDLTQRYCRNVLAYSTTPRQTYEFVPDVFYDMGDVMGDYLDLILNIDAIGQRRSTDELATSRFSWRDQAESPWLLSEHGRLVLAECLRWGDLAGCRAALGLRTVWGDRRGPALWRGTVA